jgi:hypothetical protein
MNTNHSSLPTGNLCYVVLLRYGIRIARKHWIKSFSDLSGVHELWHFKMEGLGSR